MSTQPKKRSHSVDILRGLVMVIMAIDHSRDFMTATGLNPQDLTHPNVPLFLTRWITNLCAPAFVFLAGLGSYLSFSSGKPKSELSMFLVKRGIWLIFLEMTVLRFGWMFDLNYAITELQVIWAIGWSMLALAALIYLPLSVVAGIAVTMIVGHNALDSIHAADFGAWGWVWHILHEPGTLFKSGGVEFTTIYPLVPWIGVMALGFCFGELWKKTEEHRKGALCLKVGVVSLAAFVVLRALNVYGDPERWASQATAFLSALSFIKVSKYPPSLDYLLVTLGISMLLLGLLERVSNAEVKLKPLLTLGRVPMFYYIGHIYFIHLVALVTALVFYPNPLVNYDFMFAPPPGYGYSLGVAFATWAFVVAAIYPACVWYAGIKQRYKHPLLSYL